MRKVVIENVKSNNFACGIFSKAVKQNQVLKVWVMVMANVGPRDEAKFIVATYMCTFNLPSFVL